MEDNKFTVKSGKLYLCDKLVGKSEENPGFEQYIFEGAPLGSGKNGVVYCVEHKTLKVKQAIKLYLPKDNKSLKKAENETRKNAITSLQGTIAMVHDAGKYNYPQRVWYSIMELIPNYISFKEWKKYHNDRGKLQGIGCHFDEYFDVSKRRFDITSSYDKAYIRTALNIIAGILRAVIDIYCEGVGSGDLHHENLLWITSGELFSDELNKYFCYEYSQGIGSLTPYQIKIIDLGTSKGDTTKEVGEMREAYELMDHTRFLFKTMFHNNKMRFIDWFNVSKLKDNEIKEKTKKDYIYIIKNNGNSNDWLHVNPRELAGDLYRLICVLTIAFGIIANNEDATEKGKIKLDDKNIVDLNSLMGNDSFANGQYGDVFSPDVINTINKLKNINSEGKLINWSNVWNTYPLNLIVTNK